MAQITVEQAFQIALQHHQAGQLPQAEATYRQILAQQPDHAEALHHLGVIAHQMGRHDIAVDLIRRAIALRPEWAQAHYNLGLALAASGQPDEAIAAFGRAITLKPDSPEAHYHLGRALHAKGQLDEAIFAFRQAVALKPNSPEAHTALGIALKNNGRLDEAIATHRHAIVLEPRLPEAHNNLGVALSMRGQLDEAVAAYRQAIALKGDFTDAHSNLLYALHFHPDYDAQAILAEHREWARRHAAPFAAEAAAPHDNERSGDRRLRIGYVSGDLRNHSMIPFIRTLLARHDRAAFEVFCYSNVRNEDAVSRQLREYGHAWRRIAGLDDAQAAAMIRADHVDILVDMSVHMAGNRLLVFARKPAPVQVSYLGLPATTGLGAIDYRITDPYLDPPGVSDADNTETLVRLPHFYNCYSLPSDEPVGEVPGLQNGFVTFGSLNNFCKVNGPVIQLWCDLLARVPGSRLLLLAPDSGEIQDILRRQFESHGLECGRLQLARRCSHSQYLQLYNRIDIVLDPFPHNGHMTSYDALWMGVPVVTLRGHTSVARFGVSLLSNLGLEQLIADTGERYVDIAATLAADLPRLSQLRWTLRQRVERSPIMDAAGYIRDLEAVYWQMWRQWCATVV